LFGEVSVGNVSITLPGEVFSRLERTLVRFSWRRARRATARLPWEGWERIRAIPVPCWRSVSLLDRRFSRGGNMGLEICFQL
jgi:hypothetical protein